MNAKADTTSLTIGETIAQLHRALRNYIEATYHISHEQLVIQRRRILEESGVIHQRPYLESTPRYKLGQSYGELELGEGARTIFEAASAGHDGVRPVIHDPPYRHQADAISLSLVRDRSLVVMTGTGSGKTECFLLPILGKLAREAQCNGETFGRTVAMRALILYPMNALVNDQLGRLRLLFGDERIADKFIQWTGRPARFARYTSRTLYPGVRDAGKDQLRLSPIGKYYVENLKIAQDPASRDQGRAERLVRELKGRGKWPAKPDLLSWYGRRGARWRDATTGDFKRCVTLPRDPELLTRHEVQAAPPDVLVTNYSMLEYMLMRPLERPIFDCTRTWLREDPDQRFLLVVDEAHLYRGAAGAEVALLIRRLRSRLEIPPERLQVICTSASFQDPDSALKFGAQLTGKVAADFEAIQGDLSFRPNSGPGTEADARVLASIDLQGLYQATDDAARHESVSAFLDYRNTARSGDVSRSLYRSLADFGPMATLVNCTMLEAQPVKGLGRLLFGGVQGDLAASAVTALIALGSMAKRSPLVPSLLPCRVHSFYRGLSGLWICMDPMCSELAGKERGGPTGKLFSQPRDACDCGAQVLELYTCRSCGTAYGRAYTAEIAEPDFLWAEAGAAFRTSDGEYSELPALDLLLEKPIFRDVVEPAEYDLVTGRVNPRSLGKRTRRVYIRANRWGSSEEYPPAPAERVARGLGEFKPCPVCGKTAGFGRSSVQDHQTKGDQPFQALTTKQLHVQPPGPVKASRFAPLRGRKVLVFSDSRQVAARLAPNLQTYSTQDALRPLIVYGYEQVTQSRTVEEHLSLEDLYVAVLIAAVQLGVRLRPELKEGESFRDEAVVEEALRGDVLKEGTGLLGLLLRMRSSAPPEALLKAIAKAVTDPYYGLEPLALASVTASPASLSGVTELPGIPGYAESDVEKIALVEVWFRYWMHSGIWLSRMPLAWWGNDVRGHSGKFVAMNRFLQGGTTARLFEKRWLPWLLNRYSEQRPSGKHRLRGSELSLNTGGAWAYCRACRTPQRPFPGRATCANCAQDTVARIDVDSDPVFLARKGYYREGTLDVRRIPPRPPLALIAAEHTAQLNTAQIEDVFSKAEEHELLFQDVELGPDRFAIDVLSCTTTMEVGIDIGTLSGVALRNMPPLRANYQQRAGRAGRRGNTVATVTAFGGSDSHDEHYFRHPDEMIRGLVTDPKLTLNNPTIARRHVAAYLLQQYHYARLPDIAPDEQPHLFAVLGTVSDFRDPNSVLNRDDLEQWLRTNESDLKSRVTSWLPTEIGPADRTKLRTTMIDGLLTEVDEAIGESAGVQGDSGAEGAGTEATVSLEVQEEEGEEQPQRGAASDNLLDRLLYKGVLPRYAFPTDVAAFRVFDKERSTSYRPAFRYTPSQGLPVALSQYAPGKEVWIDGKLWTSGAIYSPVARDRFRSWNNRRLYYDCSYCGHAFTTPLEGGDRSEIKNCNACGQVRTCGPPSYWLRPPGFAHPVDREEGTSPDDQPPRSYATRATLTMRTPTDEAKWLSLGDNISVYYTREHLLVTNRGPRGKGYDYCTKCGLIEPTAMRSDAVWGSHRKPFPDPRDRDCKGGGTTSGLVLGTDFISDVLLVSVRVAPPLTLRPADLPTDIALRTVCEALTKAACTILEIQPSELQAEYRPALGAAGREGHAAELYLYDTLSGGAGFAQRVGEIGLPLFEEALELLTACPADCSGSCYRCLRSYKNKFDHRFLDRGVGAGLLRYLIDGSQPKVDCRQLSQSTDRLFEDLCRQGLEGVAVSRHRAVDVRGIGNVEAPIYVESRNGTELIVGLHGPLTPNVPADLSLRRVKTDGSGARVCLYDEIAVRRNLPSVTTSVLKEIESN